ncbi:MAG: hypothetical protein HY537_02255, partial [Deltaproteobacteria bacterium]|nr:hypothetical protein [Deltaproteobacteria bacterium]
MAGWVGTRKAKLGPFSMVLTPLFLGIVIMVASCEVKHTQYQAKTPTTSGSQIENPNSGSITHGILPTGEPFTIEWIAQEAANQYFVKLRWKPLENKVLAIHRAEHGNAPSLIAQTQLGQTEFVDKNVSSNESYRYKIEVFDLSGKRIKVPVDVTLNIPKDYVLGADVISPTQQFSITEMEKGELATISEHFFGRFLRHNREALALENFNRLFLQNSQNRDRGVTIQLNDNLKDFKLDVGEIKALPGSTIIFKNVIPNKKRICLRRLRIHAKQARGELRVVMD